MPDLERFPQHQALANDMSAMLHARILGATPVETLSDRDGKLVEVVEEPDGQTFVRRSYTADAAADIANPGLGFKTSWEVMHEVFAGVGIDVVPNTLIETGRRDVPFVAACEYLADAKPMIDASVEAKVKLAGGLGKFLIVPGFMSPHTQVFNEGAFLAVQDEASNDRTLLVDVDPHLISQARLQGWDENSAFFIRQVAELIWKDWCTDDQRERVLNAFKIPVADFAISRGLSLDDTSLAFNQLQSMSNGLSPEAVRLFSRF